MKKIAWIVFAGLCIAISTYPLTYILADKPVKLLLSKSAELLSSNLYNLTFYLHITFGGIALLIGWLQFSKSLRRNYMNLHRLIGKLYVFAVLISGVPGVYIAMHASGGLSNKLGFSIGGVIWVTITYLGFRAAVKGNIDSHKKLMIFSFAGTFSAVTLRLWLPILVEIFGEFLIAYQIVAWLSWIPNLFIAYLIIVKTNKQTTPTLATN